MRSFLLSVSAIISRIALIRGRWVVEVGGQPEAGYSFQQDCLEVSYVPEVLLISPDKPGGPKRCVTNIGVNIRPMSPVWCPPWAPLSQLCLHMVGKTSSRKADQSARSVNGTVHG